MHKGIMLIVKTKDKEKALIKTQSFLEEYGEGKVWDWYAIGGRWTQTLAPMYNKFLKEKDKIIKPEGKHGFISQKQVDNKQEELQALWERLGGKGQNPYCNHYSLPNDGGYYDIVPLTECLKTVKSWQQNSEKDGMEAVKEAEDRWLKPKKGEPSYHMYGYALKCASNILQQAFSFETNVFNIEQYNFSIPENTDEYSVVMVDIHN